MQTIKIQFKNWEKFQPRKDYKHPWWFAMSNEFPTDQKLAEFTNEEKLCLVFLLCEASKQANNGELTINAGYWCRIVGVSIKTLSQVIEKIESVQIAYRICTESVPTEQNRTEQNKTEQNNLDQSAATLSVARVCFDFEMLYQKYPRKVGKTLGLKKLSSVVKTQQDFDAVNTAIENYKNYLKRNGTEAQYVKHFSTFVSSWQDWLDPNTGQSEKIIKQHDYSFLKD